MPHHVESLHAHRVGRVATEEVANHHDQIRQAENAAFEIVALALSVHVTQEENAQDDRDQVPLREEQCEAVQPAIVYVTPSGRALVDGREKNKAGDLQEADLKCIGRADLHRKRDVAVHGKRYSILGAALETRARDG